MKVVHCFTFFNEIDLLEVKLHELNDVVDHFVLSESRTTHSGRSKPLHYLDNEERFAEFKDKITALECEFPAGLTSWERENYQRNYLWRAVKDFDDEDVVIVSDADEILKASKVTEIVAEKLYPCTAEQQLYYLHADWKAPGNGSSTVIAPKRDIDALGGPHAVVRERGQFKSVLDAGWHFSSLGGRDKVLEKLQSFAHTELADATEAKAQRWFDTGTFYQDRLTVQMPSGPKHLIQSKFAHLFSPTNRDKLL